MSGQSFKADFEFQNNRIETDGSLNSVIEGVVKLGVYFYFLDRLGCSN